MFASPRRRQWVSDQPKRFSSAVMLLETHDGEALAVRSHYKPYWTLPGGVIDPGETPRQGAIRETLEEVGIKVNPAAVSFVAVIDRRSEVAETYQFIFKAPISDADLAAIKLQAGEIEAYEIVSKDQVITADRPYAKALRHWADGTMGYIEQTFEGSA
jgi:8-oxo-dGTP pyrophosphatase MutT (NUDIX family)